MRIILAALDSSAAARPVLETALGIAELTDATVQAVHVHTDSTETPEALAARAGVAYRLLDGPVETALLGAVGDPAVIAAVLGARGTPGGRRPAGRTALHIVERADKPVVVVPPEAVGVSPRPFRRLLVPLEGTDASSRPVDERLVPLIAAEVELVVLHVFTPDTTPRILDRPARDLQMLGDEFLARYCPNATRIELRAGPVGTHVADMCREEQADLIVLSWSQDMSAGRADVVRWTLGHSTVPVLLLPVDDAPIDAHSSPAEAARLAR
jgi:nucleotide-binding universal stress UspA family protein